MLWTTTPSAGSAFSPSTGLHDWPSIRDSAGLRGPASFAATAAAVTDLSLMLWPERLLLYTSVYTLRPRRCLEIGTYRGGSTALIVAALDDIGEGRVACVDPEPKIDAATWARIAHRATVIAAPSPEGIAAAAANGGGPFDWALIDGNHSYQCLVNDLEGTLPHLTPGACILFHDAWYGDVEAGLKDMFAKHSSLIDFGMISTSRVPDTNNPSLTWGGIRMARYQPK